MAEQLIPLDQATLVVNPAAPLARASEIRWQIAPGAQTTLVRAVLDPLLARAALLPIDVERFRRELHRAAGNLDISHRRFDVRIDDLVAPTFTLFSFTVVTLSNHPYGGRARG